MHFHQKCDGIGPTISIIQTIKGYKFGGYADKNWSKEGGWIKDDENAFVFSLNHMKIYNPIKGKYKYYFGENYGPIFVLFGQKKICLKLLEIMFLQRMTQINIFLDLLLIMN